jgi:hypothetical protein
VPLWSRRVGAGFCTTAKTCRVKEHSLTGTLPRANSRRHIPNDHMSADCVYLCAAGILEQAELRVVTDGQVIRKRHAAEVRARVWAFHACFNIT